MKKIISIITLIITLCLACQSYPQTSTSSGSPNIITDEVTEIDFYFNNVNVIVHLEDDAYVIHYDDPDAFDLDNMAYKINRTEWYGDYITIDIEEELLTTFFKDYDTYNTSTDWEVMDDINDKWVLIEHYITYDDSTKDLIYHIALRE